MFLSTRTSIIAKREKSEKYRYQLIIVWNHLRWCEPQSWSHSRIIFIFHPILDYKNKFYSLLIVFFMRNLPMQFVLSELMFEVTIGGLKVPRLRFSAFFGFLECLQAHPAGFTYTQYHGLHTHVKIVLPHSTTSTLLHSTPSTPCDNQQPWPRKGYAGLGRPHNKSINVCCATCMFIASNI